MSKIKKFKEAIHDINIDIKMHPKPFLCGAAFMAILFLFIDIISLFDFSTPRWKDLEKTIAHDIFNMKKLLQYSTTEEETAIKLFLDIERFYMKQKNKASKQPQAIFIIKEKPL